MYHYTIRAAHRNYFSLSRAGAILDIAYTTWVGVQCTRIPIYLEKNYEIYFPNNNVSQAARIYLDIPNGLRSSYDQIFNRLLVLGANRVAFFY